MEDKLDEILDQAEINFIKAWEELVEKLKKEGIIRQEEKNGNPV